MIIPPLDGSLAMGFALKLMWHRRTLGEIDAMIHFWRYVGPIMGVQPCRFPETFAEGIQPSAKYMLSRAYRPARTGASWPSSTLGPSRQRPGRRGASGYATRSTTAPSSALPGGFYRRYDLPSPWPRGPC
jgi:hypothetical protein